MTGGEVVLRDAARLSRRRSFAAAVRSSAAALTISAACAVILGSFRRFGLLPVSSAALAAAAAGLFAAGTAAALAAGFSRASVNAAALAADRFYLLRERMSAALECASGRFDGTPGKGYAEAVVADYLRHRDVIRPAAVFPLRFRRLHAAVPLLFAAALFLGYPELLPVRPEPALAAEGRSLQELGRRLAVRAEESSLPGTIALAEEIERLGRRIEEGRTGRDEARNAIDDLAERIEGQIKGLERGRPESDQPLLSPELRDSMERLMEDRLEPETTETLRQRLSGGGEFTPDELELLDRAYEDSLRNGAPPDAGIEDYLRRLAEGREETSERDLLDEARELLEEAGEAVARTGSTDLAGAPGEERKTAEQAGGGKDDVPDQGTGGEEGSDEESSRGEGETVSTGKPGSQAVEDEPGEASDLERASTPLLGEIRGEIAGRDAVRAVIRNLPGEQEREIEEARILADYIRRAEEIIERSDVPATMKEYVRDYFLRIGTATEHEKGDG